MPGNWPRPAEPGRPRVPRTLLARALLDGVEIIKSTRTRCGRNGSFAGGRHSEHFRNRPDARMTASIRKTARGRETSLVKGMSANGSRNDDSSREGVTGGRAPDNGQVPRPPSTRGGGDVPADRGEFGPPTPPADQGDVEKDFDLAVDAEQRGDTDKAFFLYRNILRLRPDHVRARNRLGSLLDGAGEHATALEHFREALQREPGNPTVLANIGATLGRLGRFAEAESHLRKAMEIDPESTEARLNLGILFFRRGNYHKAERELARVAERDPEMAGAHYFRGKALNRLGRLDEALSALGRATSLTPEDPGTFQLMGMIYDKKGLPGEAQVMYQRAQQLTSRKTARKPRT
jgi:Flp pilus assembly protein TadD